MPHVLKIVEVGGASDFVLIVRRVYQLVIYEGLSWTPSLEQEWVELSENPAAPANDTSTDSGESCFNFGSSTGALRSPWNSWAGVR